MSRIIVVPIKRLLPASVASVMVLASLLCIDPNVRRIFSNAQPRAYLAAAEDVPTGKTRGTRPAYGGTVRTCRYRGTEWKVETRFVPAALDTVMDRLANQYDTAAASMPAVSAKSLSAMSALGIGKGPNNSDEHSAVETYWDPRPNQPPALIVAIGLAAGNGTQLVTMESANLGQLLALAQPIDVSGLQREIQRYIPIAPASVPVDKIENELDIGTSTIYFLDNDRSMPEVARAYASRVDDLKTDPALPTVSCIMQTIERGNVRIQLFHQPNGDARGRSSTIVQIWIDKHGNA